MAISIKRLEEAIKTIPITIIEEENRSWGAVFPREKRMVEVDSIMYYVKKYINENKK